jgi:hypothetical protein
MRLGSIECTRALPIAEQPIGIAATLWRADGIEFGGCVGRQMKFSGAKILSEVCDRATPTMGAITEG